METLPFQTIRQVEAILDRVELENLVLVLSQAKGGEYLLVYNADPPPAPEEECWRARRLDDLLKDPSTYASFDGLVVGFAALEPLLPDIPTYGINFHPIDRILYSRQKNDILHKTAYSLARTLASHLRRLPQEQRQVDWVRGCTRVIHLALPTLLAGRTLDNLVAVLLPSADPIECLDADACRLIYNDPARSDDLRRLAQLAGDPGPYWIAAIEEVFLFHPDVRRQVEMQIDLRIALRQMGQRAALRDSCHALAYRCWREWETSQDRQFRDAAYMLASEYWLVDEDVADLVALAPHHDFARFAEDGQALRVYRTPVPATTLALAVTGPQCSVEDLLDWPESDTTYATLPLSFNVLAPILKRISPHDPLDLGLVLWKAGHMTEIARTFWLLSRDLLELPVPQLDKASKLAVSVWAQLNAEPRTITDLAIRSALIYSLSDPWQWRQGRYEIFIRNCYAHVMNCLLNQAKSSETSPLASYDQALYAWYRCLTADDLLHSLSEMVRACKAFQEQASTHGSMQRQHQMADRLIDIGERLLFPEREAEPYYRETVETVQQPFPVISYLRMAMDSQVALSEPSPLFEQHFRTYCLAHAEWLRVRDTIRTRQPALNELKKLLHKYRRLQRTVHMPAHELSILARAYEDDIERINRLMRVGGTEPLVKITLRNPWITLNTSERLIFLVENIGGADAEQFNLSLDPSSGFDFLAAPTPLLMPTLAPGARRRVEYLIRAKEPELKLMVAWSYRDRLGQSLTSQEVIRPEIRQFNITRAKPRGNPYEVGRPVSGRTRFFGRRNELEKILTRFSRGTTQPILLRGPRRMGKTSLMNRLAKVLRDREQRQQLDLAPELEARLNNLLPIAVSLQAIDPKVQNYNIYFLQAIIKDICTFLGVAATEQLSVDPAHWRLPARVFLEQIDWVLSQQPGARLLILIDEWDEIYRDEFRELGNNLRHIVQVEQRLSWIFSSTWTLSAEVGRFGSPWFNIFDRIELKALDWESATRLVTRPSSDVGVEWSGEAVVAVLEQTGRRPYLMQLLCSRIIDYLIQQRTNVVDIDTVEIVISRIIADVQVTEQYLGFLWSETSWIGQLILWALDRHVPTRLAERDIRQVIEAEYRNRTGRAPHQDWSYDGFDDQITWLTQVADAVAIDDGQYWFSFPLVQRWLHHVIRQRRDHIDRAFDRLERGTEQ